MKKTIKFFGIIAIVVALGIGLSACGNVHAQQPRGNTNTVERWEYKIIMFHVCTGSNVNNSQSRFNELGRDGWKLSGTFSERGATAIFKRRLP